MPIGINSPARNLFLLGSSGAQVVTNFFRKIQQPTSDDYYQPKPTSISYDNSDENYIISGTADTGSNTGPRYGWIEKRQEDGTAVWDVIRRETTGQNVFISAMELKGNDLIVAGKYGSYGGPWTPWIAKYTNGGTLDWQSTTNTGDLEYTGIAIDSNNNYYACGNTPSSLGSGTSGEAQAFVEKFDASGNPGWGKSAFMLGRDVVLTGIDTNSRGHVVAVGYLEDDRADKGYIVKIDTNTGEVLWDRTLESFLEISQFALGPHARCNDVHIDSSDNIYVIATTEELDEGFPKSVGHVIKYSPEGNIIWQNETDYSNFGQFELSKVQADDQTGNVVVFGRLITDIDSVFKTTIVISKYNKKGDLLFRRSIINSNTSVAHGLDSDSSFYYLLFTTAVSDDGYTYGKVSVSGNGLGDFEYLDGQGNTLTYKIIDIEDRIGRLSDGSLQNNRSDLITYPFNGTKILFDDLATQVSNKKRQMDDADSFEYSGSPAIRPADFQELNLLGSTGFVEGPNLITNGTFDNDINGWDGTGISLLHNSFTTSWNSNGYLEVNSNTNIGSYYGISQDVPTVNGKVYKISVDVVSGSATSGAIRVADGNLGVNPLPTQTSLGVGTHEFYFTAGTQGFSKVFLGRAANLNNGNNVAVLYDNIKVCEVSVVDQSGKGNSGTVNGATHNAAGYWEFDGTGDTINFGDTSTYKWIHDRSVSNWAIEGWFWNNLNADYGALISNNSGTSTVGFYMGQRNDDRFECVINKGTTGTQACRVLSTNQLTDNTWHHIVFVNDNYTIKLYVNGVLQSHGGDQNSFATSSTANAQTDLRIGKLATSSAWDLDGRIGEVRIYKDRALTAAQVFQNYNATKSKYINEAPDTAPKIGPGIVYDNNLLLNYDFGNRATYDRAENIVSNSQDKTGWNQVRGSITDVDIIAPDGSRGAFLFTESTETGAHHFKIPYNTGGSDYGDEITWSSQLYFKRYGSKNKIRFGLNTKADTYRHLLFDFNTGQVETEYSISGTYSIDNVGGGWYRINLTDNGDTGGTRSHAVMSCFMVQNDTTSTSSYTGDGESGVYFWGPNLKIGGVSRYIKTSGTAITAPTTVKNLSSSSYTGTIRGGATVSGGTAIVNSTGVTDYIDTGSPLLTTQANYSIEAWIKILNTSQTSHILDARDAGIDGTSFIYSSTVNKFYFQINGSNIQSTTVPAQDTWYHVVAQNSSGGNAAVYVNGVRENILGLNQSINVGTLAYNTIGIRSFDIANGQSSAAEYGEIRVYDKELTTTEVSQNFNATRGKYGV